MNTDAIFDDPHGFNPPMKLGTADCHEQAVYDHLEPAQQLICALKHLDRGDCLVGSQLHSRLIYPLRTFRDWAYEQVDDVIATSAANLLKVVGFSKSPVAVEARKNLLDWLIEYYSDDYEEQSVRIGLWFERFGAGPIARRNVEAGRVAVTLEHLRLTIASLRSRYFGYAHNLKVYRRYTPKYPGASGPVESLEVVAVGFADLQDSVIKEIKKEFFSTLKRIKRHADQTAPREAPDPGNPQRPPRC